MFLVICCFGCGQNEKMAAVNNTQMQPTTTPSGPPPPPLDARAKVVAFGDSFTAGYGIDDWRKSYPALLQDELDRAGYQLQVVNRGRSGDTSGQGLSRAWESLTTGDIHIFILALGANDSFKDVAPADTKRNLAEIIKQARAKGAKVLLCGYEPRDAEKAKLLKPVYAELAKENDVPLLPSLLQGAQQDPKLLLSDGAHPNEDGLKVVEQNVWKALQPLLRDEKRATSTQQK
ncbi:MAG: arylesterase [Pyrinomonadaceae bacterium]